MVASASERLRAYRAKRDFSITSEPAGTSPPALDGHRFVVQRHRARRLHYDVRLEAAGVPSAGPCPRAPRSIPTVRPHGRARRGPPPRLLRLRGRDTGRRVRRRGVIVCDWGTWALAEADDPLAAITAGNLHVDLLGEKLQGRVRGWCGAAGRPGRRGRWGPHGRQGLAAPQEARQGRRRRLGTRRTIPARSRRAAPTDEVEDHAGGGRRRGTGHLGHADPGRAGRARRAWARRGSGRSASTPSSSRTSTRCCSPVEPIRR